MGRKSSLGDDMESQTSRDSGITDDTAQSLWISDDRFTMDSSHPFILADSLAVHEVVSRFQNWSLGGGSATASDNRYTSPTSNTQQKGKGKNPHKRPARDDDKSGKNGKDGLPEKKPCRQRVLKGEPRLACHFQKRFPERHPTCGGWLLISHVKQHLRIKHTRSPYYCPRCNISFRTDEERDEHIQRSYSSRYQEQAYDTSTEISARVAKQLHKRVEPGCELYEQWFSVWDTIFPGVQRPATCTYDVCSELPVQVLGLYSYLENEGPGIVVSVLQRQRLMIVEAGQSMSDDLQTYIRRILFQACREIFQNWQSQREQAGPTNSGPSSVINTGPDTNMNGNVTGGIQTSAETPSHDATNTVTYTPSSTNDAGSSDRSLPTEPSLGEASRMSTSSPQSQARSTGLLTPVSTSPRNRAGESTGFDGHIHQDESFSPLLYTTEHVHIADIIHDFDLSMLSSLFSEEEAAI